MRKIDAKYHAEVRHGQAVIVNSASGEVLPEDEPLILFRAKDRFLLPLLGHYRRLCERASPQAHISGVIVQERLMRDFAADHPDRMKVPD